MERDIKAMIVDDDAGARCILKKYLEIGDNVEIVGIASDAISAFKMAESSMPDVIFLDINMPHEDGLQFASKIHEKGVDTQIVFTTAYKNFAIDAIRLKPLDYLVKPFGIEEVFDILTKVENIIEEKQQEEKQEKIWGNLIPDKLKFKTVRGYLFISPDEIMYVKVMGPLVELFLCNGTKERVVSLFSGLYAELREFGFAKVNRSLIINMKYFTNIDRKTKKCILKVNGEEHSFTISNVFFSRFEKEFSIKIG